MLSLLLCPLPARLSHLDLRPLDLGVEPVVRAEGDRQQGRRYYPGYRRQRQRHRRARHGLLLSWGMDIYIYIYIYVYIYRFTQLTLARHALSDIFIYTYTYVYRYTKTSTRRCLLPDNRVKSRYCIARGAPLAFSAGHDTTTAAAHGVYSLSVPGGGCIGTTETLCCASLARCAQRAQRKA